MAGVFSLMLHSHIPYCRKSGVWPAGEEWLFEAMNETYIPLLQVLQRFRFDNIRPRIMVGIVPVLAEQLADPYMNQRFREYMADKIRRAEQDIRRFGSDPTRRHVAEYWRHLFHSRYDAYQNHFYGDIPGTLKWLQDEGVVEILTSAATHGFLPLLARDSSIFAQIRIGIETHKKHFGSEPHGIWLPECAYRPEQWSPSEKRMRKGIDGWLADEGLRYFMTEGSSVERSEFVENLSGEAQPSTFRGYRLPSGVSVFGRNQRTGRQVWSPDGGYPGDPDYLEFHRKDSESGLHYWRVTGREEKEIYGPEQAQRRVSEHAAHFADLLEQELSGREHPDAPPVILSPYDCELFGHWWHEGPLWIDALYRKLSEKSSIQCQSLGDYVEKNAGTFSTIKMSEGSWGLNGDFTVWRNPEHGWIWPAINSSSREMEMALAGVTRDGRVPDEFSRRILRQMARELLLMQGSDWPFLLFTEQAREYANTRFHHHHQRFLKLLWAAKDFNDPSRIEEAELTQMEDLDCPWPDIDYSHFRERTD